jgi:hypothetical protein
MSERDVDAVCANYPVQIVFGVLEIGKKRYSMRRSGFTRTLVAAYLLALEALKLAALNRPC